MALLAVFTDLCSSLFKRTVEESISPEMIRLFCALVKDLIITDGSESTLEQFYLLPLGLSLDLVGHKDTKRRT